MKLCLAHLAKIISKSTELVFCIASTFFNKRLLRIFICFMPSKTNVFDNQTPTILALPPPTHQILQIVAVGKINYFG